LATSESNSPQIESREKKVVVHIVTGRLAGMRKIVGHIILDKGDELPPRFDNIPTHEGPTGTVIHAGTFPRYVLYREWKQADTGKLNDFNPEQR
jgi:hypothetical protein